MPIQDLKFCHSHLIAGMQRPPHFPGIKPAPGHCRLASNRRNPRRMFLSLSKNNFHVKNGIYHFVPSITTSQRGVNEA